MCMNTPRFISFKTLFLIKVLFFIACPTAVAEIDGSDCNAALTNISDSLVCVVKYKMSVLEKTNLQRDTSGVVQEINCLSNVSLSKGALFSSLVKTGALKFGSQAIKCNLITNRDTAKIDFVIEPEVWITGNKVTAANINLKRVIGLPSFISRRLIIQINESPEIRNSMMREFQKLLDQV